MTSAEKNLVNFGPKRCHFLFIFENFFKDFSLLIIALIIGLIQGNMDFVLENVGILVVVLIGPIGRISRFLTTFYSVDKERLIVKSGLFQKKTLEVPLSTVTTVDFSQNILHQICGVYRLNIDNAGNIASVNAMINATFRKEDAFKIRELLIRGRDGIDGFNTVSDTVSSINTVNVVNPSKLNKSAFSVSNPETVSVSYHNYPTDNTSDTEQKWQIRIKFSDLILMGLLKSKGTFFAELVALITTGLAVFNVSVDSALINASSKLVAVIGLTEFLFLCTAFIFLTALLCGMAGSLIRYYNFRITDNGRAVKIEYGLFTKKRYTIQKNRISGFLYQQSFAMKCFKTGTLQLFAIGYGQGSDESTSEEPILFPLIAEKKVRDAISEILPEIRAHSDYQKAAEKSLPYFFYSISFIVALAFLGSSIYASLYLPHCEYLWIAGLLILFYSIAGRFLEYKNAGIYGNSNNFSISCGSFKKCTVFVKTSHIESISVKAGRLKAKKGIVSIAVSYIAPISSATKTAKNVPVSCFEDIRKKLIY